jgi:tubulin polyglutamylase TTLL1/tubulin monoglycylase TTLL3/8
MGNKLSYLDFQKYLDQRFPALSGKFQAQVLPCIRRLVKDTMEATFLKLDPKRRNASFEVFGYDFMLDSDLKPWLIEVNTNPCLELSSSTLNRVIPSMLEGAFKIVLDSWFPEAAISPKKKAESLYENRWELIFSETVDGRGLLEELESRGTGEMIAREDPALADMSDEEETHSDPESDASGN